MARTSKKGDEILAFIYQQIKACGYPPSVREICEAVGLKSTSTVHAQLLGLERKGYLSKADAKTRAITLTPAAYALFEAEQKPALTNGLGLGMQSGKEYLEAPILGRVAAGSPILAVEEAVDHFPLPMHFAQNKDLFVLEVSGDSMIEAAILNGDHVIVQKQNVARNGEIVVALIDDSATVKTFYKENGHFRLQPENSAMKPIIVADVLILGKVVGVFRQL